MNYNETVEVIGEDGVSLGRAILRGQAYRETRGGLWQWSGFLTKTQIVPGEAKDAGVLTIRFKNGATGKALYTDGDDNPDDPWVELQGQGTPPKVGA